MPKSRKQRRKSKVAKRTALVQSLDVEIAAASRSAGVECRINTCHGGRKMPFLHVMFVQGPRRLLDYWPTTGTGYDRENLIKMKLPSPAAAIQKAIEIRDCDDRQIAPF